MLIAALHPTAPHLFNIGFVDDVNGYSFLGTCNGDLDMLGDCMHCGPTGDVSDTDGHGTHGKGHLPAHPLHTISNLTPSHRVYR